MFNPVQIKHECTSVEDINTGNSINTPDNSVYPIFINRDVEYKQRQLSQFWEPTQLSNETPGNNQVHNQQAVFQKTDTLPYVKDYVQNGIFFQANRQDINNQVRTNDQCHQDTTSIIPIQDNGQPLPQDMQNVRINEILIPQVSIIAKNNRLGRPPKSSMETGIGKKLKCQCEICFKEFGHKSNLFIHMRTHNGERPYKCNQCEKCFTHSGNLAIHMRTHSGERPYGCQICGKMFSHSGNLSTHLRTHSGVKPYKCSVCGKEFRHSGNLSIHERIHSGIKPFQCKICGKEFYHSGNLTTHMKKHPVNTSANVTTCENGERPMLHSDININNIVPSNYLNNTPSVLNTNNVVPIKNEREDSVLNAVGMLTSTSG